MHQTFLRLSIRACGALVAIACTFPALAEHYKQTNLGVDQSGVAATTGTNPVNPWGLSRSSNSSRTERITPGDDSTFICQTGPVLACRMPASMCSAGIRIVFAFH